MTEEEKYSKVRAIFNISPLKPRRKHQTWDQEAGLEYEVIKVIKKTCTQNSRITPDIIIS